LSDVDRPAETGDFVVIDMTALRDGEEVLGLNTEDWSYEIGQGWVTDDFDDHLVGASAGDTIEFVATPKGTEDEADFVVEVQTVQHRQLPELTDEWVDENVGEFDTVEAWTADLRETLAERKLSDARQRAGTALNDALAELVEIELPEPMIAADLNQRVQGTIQQFQAQGIDFEQWMQATGQDPESFVEGMRGQSEMAVKVDLALRAIALAENIEVTDDELEREYARMAMQYQQKAKDIRRAYEQNDAVSDLISQISKSKAFDVLVHSATYVDEDGNEIDRDALIGHTHDDHDHDGTDVDAVVDATFAAVAESEPADETPDTEATKDAD
jgi:trigger factor